MNHRQKLVQKEFLNNEKAVIKRLDQVYKKSLNDVNDKIKNLEFKIGKLQQQYDWMDPDDPDRAKVKSMIQSKIYQKQYQEQLQKQLDGIMNRMKSNQYTTIAQYLDDCYTDGFIGTVFDAHGQGVPFISPIDQEAMVRAVQLDSKISKGLYTRLGEDVDLLKKKIMAQVSRSIATSMTYAQTAQQLAGYTKVGYNNAIRITRTEGHRIQCQAGMDAMHAAKAKGANVVKQWDSTLDGRTRDSHAAIDGEVREVDKPFSNGLMFPGDPSGAAAEVVNCRCALLQRAKWALNDGFTKFDRGSNSIKEFDGIDDYKEFRKKYMKETPVGKVVKSFDPYLFTDGQKEAIEWYVSGEGQFINQHFRGRVGDDFGELSEDEKAFSDLLDEATDKVLPDDISTLYRAVDASAVFGDITDDDWYNLEQLVNYGGDSFGKGAYADSIRQRVQNTLDSTTDKVLTEKGFMSTTKDHELAEEWGGFTGSTKPIVLEFDNVPKGLKGADLKAFDIEGDEQYEVLLARNTKYKVKKIYSKDGCVHVKAEFIMK